MQGERFTKERGFRVNPQGRLEFGGCDTVSLARRYGTPLYVMNEDMIRSKAREYISALATCYPDSGVIYAGKAFLPMWMCDVAYEEGLHLDVVSGGELYTALKAGFPPRHIFFHGNNKSHQEIRMGLDAGVGRFIVDNFTEISVLSSLACQMGKTPDVLLRVAPGVEAHTHTYIETGQLDSKFGFGLCNGQAFQAVKTILEQGVLNLRGLHSHIGSQITALDGPVLAARRMVEFMARLKRELGYDAGELNLGGGLGIEYTGHDKPPSIESYVKSVTGAVIQAVNDANQASEGCLLKLPRLYLEPGRSIVGEAGITLYTAGAVKEIPGVRTYASVDGGMADNPRPALYGATYRAIVANRPADALSDTVCLAGKCCESGDILIKEAEVPSIRPGDIVAVLCTGAYNYSMVSGYNKLPRPAVVAVSGGRAKLIVRRQSYDDLLAHEIPPARLRRSAEAFELPAATGGGS